MTAPRRVRADEIKVGDRLVFGDDLLFVVPVARVEYSEDEVVTLSDADGVPYLYPRAEMVACIVAERTAR